jgi:hypothetical protein
MSDEDRSLFLCHADRDESLFFRRVVGIVERLGERIQEHVLGFLERDAVLPLVRGGLDGIPLVNHEPIVPGLPRGRPQPACVLRLLDSGWLTSAFRPRRLMIALTAAGCKRLMLIQPSSCLYSAKRMLPFTGDDPHGV